jgi:hypothetical protein
MSGGCQCGAVRYALTARPTNPGICHCRMCQKAFGSYFAPLAGVRMAELVWTRGRPATFQSSEAAERGFCRDCGTPLTYHVHGRNRISVSIGSLDDPDFAEPVEQDGMEGRRPILDRLATLPGSRTEESASPEMQARMQSRQHPDHDTEAWPPAGHRP